MKLLIVEDNELMRRLMRNILDDLGAAIEECSNGREAIAAFERERPDWILMDIEMAEMDGLTASAEILASDPAARIVIVTQHDSKQLREAARKIGAIAFIAKENLLGAHALIASAMKEGKTTNGAITFA